MALIVEDGTGLSTAEAYVSVVDARAAAVKLGLGYLNAADPTGAWIAAASDADLEASIRRATYYLEGKYFDKWAGISTTSVQALAFPRRGIIKRRVFSAYADGAAYSLGPRTSYLGLPGGLAFGYGGYGYGGYPSALGGPYGYGGSPGATYLPQNVVPSQVVLASVEVALRELAAPGSLLPDYLLSGAISSEGVGPVHTSYFDRGPVSNSPKLPMVDQLLLPLLSSNGTATRGLFRS